MALCNLEMEKDYGRCVVCVMSDHLLITFSVTPKTRLLLRSRVISNERFRAESEGRKSLLGPRRQAKFLQTLEGSC